MQILSATLVASRRDLGILHRKAEAVTSELQRVQAEFEDVSSSLLVMREHAEALELSVLEARTQLVYLKRKEEHEKEFLREMISSKADQGKVRAPAVHHEVASVLAAEVCHMVRERVRLSPVESE